MIRGWAVAVVLILGVASVHGADLLAGFQNPPAPASPWVLWYWTSAAVSAEGITADLEAMKAAGIGGAHLVAVKDVTDPPLLDPPVRQLTPEFWRLVVHAMKEADRLGLKLAMHACDGFSIGGGPWITPELSMQKVVWSETHVAGGRTFNDVLAQPPMQEDFYRDIAVLAFPSSEAAGLSTRTVVPKVTTSVRGADPQFLVVEGNTERLRSNGPCWIQYAFAQPFTCRSISVCPDGTSYPPLCLRVETSDDGQTFRLVQQLEAPRHGWQNGDADMTYAIASTTARFFRFVYDPNGLEPGAEDLDTAKWRPTLRVRRIELFSAAHIHQFEGKSGQVWRIARRTTSEQIPDDLCVPQDRIVDVTRYMDSDGRLRWDVPEGNWTILRLGHTSTGHRTAASGGGTGLECDKFRADAVRLQFDRWFGEAIRQAGPELSSRVLKVFYLDSWEAGSQNWSPVFREEFKQRRGYDLLPYLPVMAGIPVGSADVSERFLYDVRTTIDELVSDRFYKGLAELAHAHGCVFSAENVAPTMTSDGMRHFAQVDIPMGEFWLRSPTHDKPNDILDAISAAHVYGKPLVQAEAFTELRFAWDEYPAMLKTLGDRNFALGINRFAIHVFMHNPWVDRQPGTALGMTGLFFQRDQTWWGPGRAWVDYLTRCQVLLQTGRPVVDVAVFTGEELPRRAVLPERLVSTLPGVFGADVVQRESERLANRDQPMRQLPRGVTASANISDPADWVDPLCGYAYDSINPEALRHATVRDGRITLPGGASYALLVWPGSRPMAPDMGLLTPETAAHLAKLIEAGATVVFGQRPERSPSLEGYPDCDGRVAALGRTIADAKPRVVRAPFTGKSFETLGIAPDFVITETNGQRVGDIAWTHRAAPDIDVYFIANQQDQTRTIEVSLRVAGRMPELWDPLTGEVRAASQWRIVEGRTILPLRLDANGSIFVVLRELAPATECNDGTNWLQFNAVEEIEGPWEVTFDPKKGGPEAPVSFAPLVDWTQCEEPGVRYYCGTAAYTKTFDWNGTVRSDAVRRLALGPDGPTTNRVWLDLGGVANLAEVIVNGRSCGVAWTAPFRVEITDALRRGSNRLEIRVTNTWANRLRRDQSLPEADRVTWTSAYDVLGRGPLLPAGLLGPVQIVMP